METTRLLGRLKVSTDRTAVVSNALLRHTPMPGSREGEHLVGALTLGQTMMTRPAVS